MPRVLRYAEPGIFTELPADLTGGSTTDPVEVCWPVHNLVLQPDDAADIGIGGDRLSENQIRSAGLLVDCLLAMNAGPLAAPRRPEQRVLGTCRHFAVLACALLRAAGVASRVRCGFATYFQPGQALDHWVVEYQEVDGWVRLDPEILGGSVLDRPDRLRPDQFLSGAEAWIAYRQDHIDPSTFGVYGTDNFGPAEIRGNAVKDLAALNKVEMLPWDEWGRMTDAYEGRTGADYDGLLDELAAASASDDLARISTVYEHPDLTVPPRLLTDVNHLE